MATDAVFEALCVQIFRVWGQRTLVPGTRFSAIYGAGGDHGVEAIHQEPDGRIVGLQVKYHQAVDSSILSRLSASLDAARARYPELRRYIVAMPRDRMNKQATPNSRRDELSRWDAWERKSRSAHPGLEIDYWGKTELEAELATPEAAHFQGFFFGAMQLDSALFKARVEGALGTSTFRHRYLPELHTELAYERRIKMRLGVHEHVEKAIDGLKNQIALAQRVAREIARLPRLDASYTDEETTAHRVGQAAVATWLVQAGGARDWLAAGLQGSYDLRAMDGPMVAIQELFNLLRARTDNSLGRAPTSLCVATLERFIARWSQVSRDLEPLHRVGEPMVLCGPAGSGKTHALAHLAQEWIAAGRPALIKSGADFDPPPDGVHQLLESLVDRRAESPEQLLAALEGASELAARTVASSGQQSKPGARALLIIDGIDEQPGHLEAWHDLIVKLAVATRPFPRVQVVLSLRDTALSGLWGPQTGPEPPWVTVEVEPEELSIECLFEGYSEHHNLDSLAPGEGAELRWWFTTPLHVRLYFELYKATGMPPTSPTQANIAALFGYLLEEASRGLRDVDGEKPCAAALLALVEEMQRKRTRALKRGHALRLFTETLSADCPVAARRPEMILKQLESWGFVLVDERPSDDPYQGVARWVLPAYEAVIDYLLARAALARGDEAWRELDARSYALELYALMRTTRDGSFAWLKGSALEDDEPRGVALYLNVLSQVPAELAAAEESVVARLLTGSMPGRGAVLFALVVRVMRRRDHPFGPSFVHRVLRSLTVADRDIVWSGPSRLRGPPDVRWSGRGPGPLPYLALRADDRADGPPLLLAWATTSLERVKRERARRQLSRWMAGATQEVSALLDYLRESNDPQMHADVIAALASASLRWGKDAPWGDVVASLEAFYGALDEEAKDDCVLRAGLWVILQRGRFLGALEPDRWWGRVAPAGDATRGAVEDRRLLRLWDKSLSSQMGAGGGIASKIVGADLSHQVLRHAYEPFWGGYSGLDVSPRHATLLSRHAEANGHNEITVRQLALAAIEHAARAWGWTEERFYGDPRGEGPGEVLGYDIAVSRQHLPARHGRQSVVASSAEKYTWLAVNRVVGFFADRLDLERSGRFASDLSGFGSGLQLANDAAPLGAVASEVPTWRSALSALPKLVGWSPRLELADQPQADAASRWQQEARLPTDDELRAWLIDGAGGWIALRRSFLSAEAESLCEVFVHVGSIITQASKLRKTSKSIRSGDGFAEGHTAIASGGFYVPPALALWAPWMKDVRDDDQRENTATKVYFEEVGEDGVGHERSIWLPGERFRHALHASTLEMRSAEGGDRREARFFDRAGDEVGRYELDKDIPLHEHAESLTVHPNALASLGRDLLVWHVHMIRDPAYYLYPRAEDRPDPVRFDWMVSIDQSERLEVHLSPDLHRVPATQGASTRRRRRVPRR